MKPLAWLLLGIAASAVSWTYMHRVLLPWEHYINVERGRVKQEMGDLYPRWVGTRELLLHGRNPYGQDVSHEIQMAFYGHPIEQTYDKPEFEIIDEQRFAYPVYVVFLLAPTVHADFWELQRWAPVGLGVLVAISVWLWLRVLQWRPPLALIASLILFVLSSPQIAQGLRLRQFGFLVALLLALATWSVARSQYALGGILLAAATIKPQMVALPILWFLIWSAGDWKKRWPLVAGFVSALAVLAGAGELLLHGWIRYFFAGIEVYPKYFPQGAKSVLRLILGNWVGGIFSVLAVAVLLTIGWNRRRAEAGSPQFAQVLSLFFIAATLVLPLLTPYNQVLLFLPVAMILRDWKMLPRWVRSGFALLIAWPYVASMALLLHRPQLDSMARTPLLPSILLPLIPFVLPLLMFARRQKEA